MERTDDLHLKVNSSSTVIMTEPGPLTGSTELQSVKALGRDLKRVAMHSQSVATGFYHFSHR